MSKVLWISNGRVIDPKNKRDGIGDLYAVDGKIVASLTDEQKKSAEKVDASGLVVCPGFVDIHVHFREPGQTHKESILTGSEAAAAGGFTSVVCMANTTPPIDNPGLVQSLKDIIARDAIVNVYLTATLTKGMEGKELSPTGSLKKAGVVALTDDGLCVQDNEIMRRGVEYAHMHGLPVSDHCQDVSLTRGAVMHEGDWSLRLGLKGWPAAAEDLMVSRNIILSEYTGAQIHLQHISSAYSVDLIRGAKKRGVNVTAEATPHHITLTDSCLKDYNTNFKMNPPLRTDKDRAALIAGLLDGSIDAISTDHAPHSFTEKDQEIDKAPFGIIGLETSFAVCMETLVEGKHCDLPFLIGLMTCKASEVLKLGKGTLSAGEAADIAIIDPDETWVFDKSSVFGRSKNSPWLGKTFKGRVKKTIVAGKIVFDGNKIIR